MRTCYFEGRRTQYHFPDTEEEIAAACTDFAEISTQNLIRGCVGCIDGLLLRITAPKSREAKNGTSYYSGHYRDFGINVQAICDSNCRFIFAALAAPGGTNDIAAYRKTSIMEKIENLPIGKYVIGDNAYVCTEHLLTPFSGDDKKDPMKDAYNFHLSQVRIRIEMTFGQFINKWRYFGRSSQLSIKNHGMLFMCATRLGLGLGLSDRPHYPSVFCNNTLLPHGDILKQTFQCVHELPTHFTYQTLIDFKANHDPSNHPLTFKLSQKICNSKLCTKSFLKDHFLRIPTDNTEHLPQQSPSHPLQTSRALNHYKHSRWKHGPYQQCEGF